MKASMLSFVMLFSSIWIQSRSLCLDVTAVVQQRGPEPCDAVPVVVLTEGNPVFYEVEQMFIAAMTELGHEVTVRGMPNCNVAFVRGGQEAARRCALDTSMQDPRDHQSTVYITASYCIAYHERYDRYPKTTIFAQMEPVGMWSGRPCFGNTTYLEGLRGKPIWDYARVNARHLQHGKRLYGAPYEIIPMLAFSLITAGLFSEPASVGEAGRDIDVFFLGGTGDARRPRILNELRSHGLNVVILDGSLPSQKHYDKGVRESYFRRAKIVLNVHRGPDPAELDFEQAYDAVPLEVVRLQYLLAARNFVISEEAEPAGTLPYRAAGAVVFAPYSRLVDTVLDWLARPAAERHAVADRGYEYIYSRSMADVLREPMQRAIRHLHGAQCKYPDQLYTP